MAMVLTEPKSWSLENLSMMIIIGHCRTRIPCHRCKVSSKNCIIMMKLLQNGISSVKGKGISRSPTMDFGEPTKNNKTKIPCHRLTCRYYFLIVLF